MPKIAQTLFQGAALDKLPVADVYNAPTIDLLSSSVTGVKNVLGSVFTNIRASGFNLSTLANMLDIKGGDVSLDPDQAKSRLNSLLGVNITSIKDLSPEAQLRAVNKLSSLAGVNVSQITDASGHVLKVANGVNARDVQGVLNGFKTVLGDIGLTSIVDATAKMAFIGSLMEYSTEWGLADTISTIMDKFEKGTTERDYLEYTLTNSFSAACVTGELDTLITIIKNTGPDKLMATYPTAINMVLGGYQFRADDQQADYPALLVKFLGVLTSLDPQWDSSVRNNQVVNKLAPFQTASRDARTLLSYNNDYWDCVLVADSYPLQDAVALVKTTYPGIAI